MSFVPGMGILKGMALTLRRFFAPKVTIRYPEGPTSRSSTAAGSSSCTTSTAR